MNEKYFRVYFVFNVLVLVYCVPEAYVHKQNSSSNGYALKN